MASKLNSLNSHLKIGSDAQQVYMTPTKMYDWTLRLKLDNPRSCKHVSSTEIELSKVEIVRMKGALALHVFRPVGLKQDDVLSMCWNS